MQNIHVTNGANEVTPTPNVQQQALPQPNQQTNGKVETMDGKSNHHQIEFNVNGFGVAGFVLSLLSLTLIKTFLTFIEKISLDANLYTINAITDDFLRDCQFILGVLDAPLIFFGAVFSFAGILSKPKSGLAVAGLILSLFTLMVLVFTLMTANI